MRNIHLVLLCLFLTGLQATAQKTFPGSYVNSSGEKVNVRFTDYKQWKYNPAQLTVRTDDGKEILLTPQNTRSFTVNGYDTYVSRKFSRLTNSTHDWIDYTYQSPNDSLEQIHGFLLLVTETGGVRLYKYTDKIRTNYFIEKVGDTLTELHYKVFQNNAGAMIHDIRYREQLREAFADRIEKDNKLYNRLERLEYSEDQLEQFMEQVAGDEKRKEKMYPAELFAMGGLAINTFEVNSASFSNNSSRARYSPTVAPVIGISLIEYSQRNFARQFLSLQFRYYRFRNTGTFTAINKEESVVFDSHVFNVNVGVGRNLVKKPAFTWYTSLGPNVAYLPNSRETYSGYSGNNQKESLVRFNLNLQTGLHLKGGLGLWLHYNVFPLDVQQYVAYDNQHRSVQLGVDWKLKKGK